METVYIVNEQSLFCGKLKLDETKQKVFWSESAANKYIKSRAEDWGNRGWTVDHMGREVWIRDRVNTVFAKINYHKTPIEG